MKSRKEFYFGGAFFSNDDVIDDVITCDFAKTWEGTRTPLPPLPVLTPRGGITI